MNGRASLFWPPRGKGILLPLVFKLCTLCNVKGLLPAPKKRGRSSEGAQNQSQRTRDTHALKKTQRLQAKSPDYCHTTVCQAHPMLNSPGPTLELDGMTSNQEPKDIQKRKRKGPETRELPSLLKCGSWMQRPED